MMSLTRFGGSAYDLADVCAIARVPVGLGLLRRAARRMAVVLRGGVYMEAEGEDAEALIAYVATLPAYEPESPSAGPRDVISRPGIVRPADEERG